MNVDYQQEEAPVQFFLEDLAHEIHSLAGVRMHKLNVCEWEVKLRISSPGKANGLWRVVVTNVTGQTCSVHVSYNFENLFFNLVTVLIFHKLLYETVSS